MELEILAVALTIAIAVATSIPIGRSMARVFSGERTLLDRVFVPIERLVLLLSTVDTSEEQDWKAYTRSILVSNSVMWVAAFAVVTLQGVLFLNPDKIAGMGTHLAFNTVSSFVTNTNLQHYSGETGLSYLSQMIAVVFLQFVSAATGMAALVAILRALGGNRLTKLGNFYVDATRAAVRVLLPLAIVVAVVLLWQGTPMTFEPAAQATTVEGAEQIIARGPVAAEVAIKQLGTNGGGFFGPNSAHPYENPTPLSNLVETWAILIIPMAMVWTLGEMLKRRRLALVIFVTMLALYLPLVGLAVHQEIGSMEGKEVRFGTGLSALWAASTTVTSNGSVNSMHDSMTPLGGLVPLIGMWLNNIFGGVGVGFINMLIFIIVTVFVTGMMIGRTPEFLGKKVEGREMKLASLAMLLHPLLILGGTAIACAVFDPAWLKNPGPHGFSEMLYEFTSAAANNGSGFEGLGDNTAFWNISTGLVMLLGRYLPIIAPLAMAASLAAKPAAPEGAGSLRADTPTFGLALWSVVVVLGLLMFMPVAVLGPIAEFLAMS
ncbi:MAG: potassium-transporting ATPase subunit KdpA [Thermoanaerobaculia bacterium]